MNKKNIFIITQGEITNVVGGAISITINMCNLLVDKGYEVYCICSNKVDGKPNNINSKVKFINLAYKYNNLSFSEGVNKLSKEINPDLFIFFFPYLYKEASLSDNFKNTPKILMFHSRPDVFFNDNYDELQELYSNDNNIISQILFDSYKCLLPDFIKNKKIITVHNGVQITNKTINTDIEHKKIVYLSRIDCWKGLELLINSFKLIANKNYNWSIDIYGQSQPEGYVNKLKKIVKKLGLEKQIYFKGVTKNPIETMLNYDFCVFPSYYEGFPLGLVEALSVGLPCIGLQETTGVNEIIINGENGFLVQENYDDFSQKIDMLINNKELRAKLSKNAKLSVYKYDKEKIDDKWIYIIENMLNNKISNIEDTPDVVGKKIFSLEKIQDIHDKSDKILKPIEYVFSIKNSQNKKYKIITIFGIKFKRKRKPKIKKNR